MNGVCFTGDQDWAPDWALERFVEIVEDVPFHLFRTGPSSLLDGMSCGWHPNFQPGSSHGDSISAVIETCRAFAPSARSVRTHAFVESSAIWQALASAGIVVASHPLTSQKQVAPIHHWTGITFLPVFYEDDIHYTEIAEAPGIRLVSFHPIHLAMNTPSQEWYEQERGGAYAGTPVEYAGRGVRDIFYELTKESVVPFESLVDSVLTEVPDTTTVAADS